VSEIELPDPVVTSVLRRERPIVWQAVVSLALHLAVLSLLLWPALRTSLEAAPPDAIEVELVVPSEEPSSEPPPSAPEEEAPSAAEQPSGEASQSAEPSGEISASEEPRASQEAASQPSAPEPPSEAANEPPPPSASPSAAEETSAKLVAPVPMSRPLVIAVGSRDKASTETSSAEESGVAELTAEAGDIAAGDTVAPSTGEPDSPATAELGELTVAKTFYLAEILGSSSMAQARETLRELPHDKRVSRTCNIEAIGQVGAAGRGFAPDALIADALGKSAITGTRLTATGAIFRSEQRWYALSFDCTLNDDLSEVAAFSFRLGPDVTALVTKPL
jgi:outer membrane biosynthesis protein TonB